MHVGGETHSASGDKGLSIKAKVVAEHHTMSQGWFSLHLYCNVVFARLTSPSAALFGVGLLVGCFCLVGFVFWSSFHYDEGFCI